MNVTPCAVKNKLAALNCHEWIKKRFQSQCLRMLMQHETYNHEGYIRKKLERWRLQEPLGIVTRRAIKRISHIFSLVPPRVASVVFRAWLNGWCIRRRCQRSESTCMLKCSMHAEDSLEHYARCPVVIETARRIAPSLTIEGTDMSHFLSWTQHR